MDEYVNRSPSSSNFSPAPPQKKTGDKITPPGLPLSAKERVEFITEDSIQPPALP
jgi:hypothetical protein